MAAGRAAFAVGALSGLFVVIGFAIAALTDVDGSGADVGLAFVTAGSIGLTVGPLVTQVREGILAMRREISPAPRVGAATVAFLVGVTGIFLLGATAALVFGRGSSDADWTDVPAAALFFVPWVCAVVTGAVVIAVVAVVQRLRRGKSRPGITAT